MAEIINNMKKKEYYRQYYKNHKKNNKKKKIKKTIRDNLKKNNPDKYNSYWYNYNLSDSKKIHIPLKIRYATKENPIILSFD